MKSNGPKVLLLDIETAPIIAHCWSLWENNVSLDQIVSDWHILSWSAKWLGDAPNKIMYADQSKAKDIKDDKVILQKIWNLLDEADVIIGQNSKKFDQKKLNARFVIHGMQPPSSYKHVDTLEIAKKHFAFTSNKLAYMSEKLNKKYKKLKHKKFPGHEMWVECLKGNKEAWRCMEKYNKYDVLALEETYQSLMPWDNTINFNVYHDDTTIKCHCGSTEFHNNGYAYTASGKFQRYKCIKCGSETRGRVNLLSKEKKASLRPRTNR